MFTEPPGRRASKRGLRAGAAAVLAEPIMNATTDRLRFVVVPSLYFATVNSRETPDLTVRMGLGKVERVATGKFPERGCSLITQQGAR